MSRLQSRVWLVLFCSVLVGACGERTPALLPLPEGVQTMTGVVLPTELSLVRRGTHVLSVDGENRYYLESAVVNLRRLERRTVQVEGTLEYNTDPHVDAPVLVVTRATEAQADARKPWSFKSLGISLTAPDAWSATVKEGLVEFRVPGGESPFLVIRSVSKRDTPVVGGVPIILDGKRAVRMIDEVSGEQSVVLDRTLDTLVFRYTPSGDVADGLREEWLAMLNSVRFATEVQSSVGPVSGSGSGTPCGGPAGVLCPTGYFCEITFVQENIGACRKL